MKTLTILSLGILCLCACKKESSNQTIQGTLTAPAYTQYLVTIKNSKNDVVIQNDNINLTTPQANTFTLLARSGDRIPITYNFNTQEQQYGQGKIVLSLNGKTLLSINGGSGTQTLVIP